MQTACLGYQSALDYLCRERYFSGTSLYGRGYHADKVALPPSERTARISALPRKCPSDDDVAGLLDGCLRGMAGPVHFIVSQRDGCWDSALKVCHVWGSPIVSGMLGKADGNLLTSSAEFCLLQLACELGAVELARLITELCGTYALAPSPQDEYRNCPPATSLHHVSQFGRRMQRAGMRGARNLLRAVRFSADGAASPMETAVFLLLRLPLCLGGYGVEAPQLNARPRVGAAGGSGVRRRPHRCDLLWAEQGVALEYEGERWHTGPARITDDSLRDNALSAQGCRVIRVTKEQLYRADAFDDVARQICTLLGRRLRIPSSYNWFERRAHLRHMLLPTRGNRLCNERAGRSPVAPTL